MESGIIYTAVSRPGPVEVAILGRLEPAVRVRPRLAAGVALRSLESSPIAGRPALLFLHGRGHAASVWAAWLAAFATLTRTVAVDLPGFGHSGAAPLADGSVEAGLRFFADPVEQIAIAEGPVVLVGHSLGALVAIETALRGRADVRGLVLIGAMGLSPVISPRARLYLRAGPERLSRLTSFVRRAGGSEIDRLRRELHSVRGGRPQAKEAFDRLVPLVGGAFERAARLGEIDAPTLLVWGRADDAFPLPVAMQAAARMRRAELKIIEAEHSPHLERADACIALVRPFIESLLPPTSRTAD
ncbi:MAG: alpha/beta fold hydrolase [Myxococcales bacterium]|nr:alpha/beta fold hydrolase [Myxococcales bacterium]